MRRRLTYVILQPGPRQTRAKSRLKSGQGVALLGAISDNNGHRRSSG
jgi:hypothetical protein